MPHDPLREFVPIEAGQRLRIVPPELRVDTHDDRVVLRLERGAFGSGEHETTLACLQLLEQLTTRQDRPIRSPTRHAMTAPSTGPSADGEAGSLTGAYVLDVGSGTGVLAIGALLLGARRAVCVDPEPEAVSCAKRNAALNAVTDAVDHVCGVLDDVGEGPFDVVVANLYGHLLGGLATGIVRRCRPGAPIILSGMLWEQDWEVRSAFLRCGCTELVHRMMEEFSAVLLAAP